MAPPHCPFQSSMVTGRLRTSCSVWGTPLVGMQICSWTGLARARPRRAVGAWGTPLVDMQIWSRLARTRPRRMMAPPLRPLARARPRTRAPLLLLSARWLPHGAHLPLVDPADLVGAGKGKAANDGSSSVSSKGSWCMGHAHRPLDLGVSMTVVTSSGQSKDNSEPDP